METSTDGSVEDYNNGYNRVANSDAWEGLFPFSISTIALQGSKAATDQDRPTTSIELAHSHIGIEAASDSQ